MSVTASNLFEQPQTPPSRLSFLILTCLLLLVRNRRMFLRLALPDGSHQHRNAYDWPILGSALQFYRKGSAILVQWGSLMQNRTFSFLVGSKRIVNVGGLEGRKTFHEIKELNLAKGFVEVLADISSASEERQIKVREEVDTVVARHRTSSDQTATDMLDTLPLDVREAKFPTNDIRLRKSARLVIPGTTFRKDTSGRDILIGKSGEVIPDGAPASYLLDSIHMSSNVYPDTSKSNARRYPVKGREAMKSHTATQVRALAMTPVRV